MSVINFREEESVIEWGNKRKRVIRELVKGREYATQLNHFLLHLQNPIAAAVGSPSAKELVTNVLRSFADTLSVLTNSSEAGTGSNDIPRSEKDSSESRKRLLPATIKDRRGSYKRRKTEQTWTKVSDTTDDNHAWRKYGQKEILNSQFPRSYFRCTRKYEQGCRATRQVQRIQENPDKYQITYIGFHTCKTTTTTLEEAPQAQVVTYNSDTTCCWDSFDLVNSQAPPDESKTSPNESQDPPQSSLSINQEYPNDDRTTSPSDLTDNLDANLWSDYLKDFELSKPANAINIRFKMASHDNIADTAVYSSCCTDHDHSQNLHEMDHFGVFSSDPHFTTDLIHF